MAKCIKCGRHGIFLKLQDGLCSNCIANEAQQLEIRRQDAQQRSESVHNSRTRLVSDLTASEEALLAQISQINATGRTISPELDQQLRDFEMNWLERHYDFNSIEGINNVPLVKNLRCPKTNGVTGEVYYYLRHKAYEHEKAGRISLAIACMQKSSALVMANESLVKSEYYPLIKILARNGYVTEAQSEKEKIDTNLQKLEIKWHDRTIKQLLGDLEQFGTDLVIMSVHSCSCSECAKYQGRVYSVYGRDHRFPKVPNFFYRAECVHSGCGHTFSPYIHGVNDPDLEYTLSVHPLKNKEYGRNIITFSNRPFVDDRTEDAKAEATAFMEKHAVQVAQDQYTEDHMIEYEYKKYLDSCTVKWLQENIPDKAPKNVTGFRRMKTQNTKNYQALKQFAAEHGREI